MLQQPLHCCITCTKQSIQQASKIVSKQLPCQSQWGRRTTILPAWVAGRCHRCEGPWYDPCYQRGFPSTQLDHSLLHGYKASNNHQHYHNYCYHDWLIESWVLTSHSTLYGSFWGTNFPANLLASTEKIKFKTRKKLQTTSLVTILCQTLSTENHNWNRTHTDTKSKTPRITEKQTEK